MSLIIFINVLAYFIMINHFKIMISLEGKNLKHGIYIYIYIYVCMYVYYFLKDNMRVSFFFLILVDAEREKMNSISRICSYDFMIYN